MMLNSKTKFEWLCNTASDSAPSPQNFNLPELGIIMNIVSFVIKFGQTKIFIYFKLSRILASFVHLAKMSVP